MSGNTEKVTGNKQGNVKRYRLVRFYRKPSGWKGFGLVNGKSAEFVLGRVGRPPERDGELWLVVERRKIFEAKDKIGLKPF